MTYSHNNKMMSSASVRIRGGSSHNHYNNQHQHQSYYHSSASASSTNLNLSTSPSGSTSSNCSTSSSVSSICASSRKSLSPKNNRCTGGNYFSNNNHYQQQSSSSPVVGSGGRKNKNNHRGAVHILGSSPPTNLTHFAGSKCFDAPAPTALPKPPQHWTEKITSKSCISSKRNLLDDFNTHNLKLLLNVQS